MKYVKMVSALIHHRTAPKMVTALTIRSVKKGNALIPHQQNQSLIRATASSALLEKSVKTVNASSRFA